MKPEADVLKEVAAMVDYFPESGLMVWRERPRSMFRSDGFWSYWNATYAGQAVGTSDLKGYKRFRFANNNIRVHRLAFFMVHGRVPLQIDHINHDPSDNRICNLREATSAQNAANRRTIKSNTSGVRGVSFNKKDRKWVTFVQFNKRRVHLGNYNDIETAKAARDRAAREMHGEFVNIEPMRTPNAIPTGGAS